MVQKKFEVLVGDQKVEVSEEIYVELQRENTATRKREQYHGRCACPWELAPTCNGDCFGCRWHREGDMVSIDAPLLDKDNGQTCLANIIPDTGDMVADIERRELFEALHREIAALKPEDREICTLCLAGWRERDIALRMGISKSKVNDRKKKIFDVLAERLGPYYF